MIRERVAVVTGAAVGIGAAIAEELGRQGAFVVTVDPGVAVDGSPGTAGAEASTAQRIVDAGGRARASAISVTDAGAVDELFGELVDEFGALDAVVNVAGISRPTSFASGAEEDWRAVLGVHLDGYLNVLGSALPRMAEAGHGRILGVTSGSGWRAADAGGYSCAKRAVAALTWQVGAVAPPGVTVNALSPIAATRMVAAALSRQAAQGNTTGRSAASGGVSLGAGMPPPEHLGPVGAYLASEAFSWCTGQVMFSNGSEVAWVGAPRLLEVVQTSGVESLGHALETLVPTVLAPAEAAQATSGGGNPRAGSAFEARAETGASGPKVRCVIVTDRPAWGAALTAALVARGVECVDAGARGVPAGGFAAASAQLAGVARDRGPVDAVVVALAGASPAPPGAAAAPAWQRVLDEHAGLADRVGTDAAWVRAVADHAAAGDRPVRIVTIVDATTSGGRSRAQAAAQLARSAHAATSDRVDALVVGVEADEDLARQVAVDAVAHLVSSAVASGLSGAELVAAADWFALRTHPNPIGTISFRGPAVPDWVDGALRELVGPGLRPGAGREGP